jgi:Flp pilus assembly pilin Flp
MLRRPRCLLTVIRFLTVERAASAVEYALLLGCVIVSSLLTINLLGRQADRSFRDVMQTFETDDRVAANDVGVTLTSNDHRTLTAWVQAAAADEVRVQLAIGLPYTDAALPQLLLERLQHGATAGGMGGSVMAIATAESGDTATDMLQRGEQALLQARHRGLRPSV